MDSRTPLLCAAALLLAACDSVEQSDASYAAERLATAEDVQQQANVQLTPQQRQSTPTVRRAVLGRDIGPDGAISDTQRTEQFAPGEPIYMAVEVDGAAPHTPVRVAWYGPGNTLLREDTKEVLQEDRYVHFGAEESQDWNPGEYRAEIWLRDEKVNEQRFAVLANRGPSTGRMSGS